MIHSGQLTMIPGGWGGWSAQIGRPPGLPLKGGP